jgi:hypothetical protein
LHFLVAGEDAFVLFLFFDEDEVPFDLFFEVGGDVRVVGLFWGGGFFLAKAGLLFFVLLVDCFYSVFHLAFVVGGGFAFGVVGWVVGVGEKGGYFGGTVVVVFLEGGVAVQEGVVDGREEEALNTVI